MHVLSAIVAACVLAGVVSVLLAALFLVAPERFRTSALPLLVSFAIGSLLAAAFIDLVPEAFAALGVEQGPVLGGLVLLGLLLFFLVEKYVLWVHCHGEEPETHLDQRSPAGALVLVGDSLHNFIDGVILAAAFLSNPRLGTATAIAVLAHEIPHEIGDFAVLLHSGYSRRSAFAFNVASGVFMVLGGLLGYVALSEVQRAVPYLVAFAASSFIYIALADLIPEQHRRLGLRATLEQLALILAGVALIAGVHLWLE